MKDIDLFTTQYGVASLILKEIPYSAQAYILIRETSQPEELLQECCKFCGMCGAKHIFAAGHPNLEAYPLHTAILRLRGKGADGVSACLWPVTAENVAQWRGIYNEKMRGVDNAATLSAFDEKLILEDGGAYFVHEQGELLGIGWLSKGELLAIAAVKPGTGSKVLQTMLSLAGDEPVVLDVASTNQKALRLYEKNGFLQTEEMRRWYCVQ